MLVMKFGGSSVADRAQIEKVVAIVRERLDKRPVVVCSAHKGITDALIRAARAAAAGQYDPEAAIARQQAIARELGPPLEVIVGFVQTPGMSNDDRIRGGTTLIDHVGRARTNDINCRLARTKHDSVPEGIVALAKQEKVDKYAMYTDPNRLAEERPEGSLARKVKELASCEVRVFDTQQLPAVA